MSVGVKIPQRTQGDGLKKLLTIGGAAAGGIFGGPAGAGAGATLAGTMAGASAGGLAGDLLKKPEREAQSVESGALSRRMQQLDQSPLRQIRESINSLQYVQDEQQRASLAQPLLMAEQAARKGRV